MTHRPPRAEKETDLVPLKYQGPSRVTFLYHGAFSFGTSTWRDGQKYNDRERHNIEEVMPSTFCSHHILPA